MFHVNPLHSHEISSIIYQKNYEKIFKTVVCCSRDWRFKDSLYSYASKNADGLANSVQSDQGPHCLLRPIFHNTYM